MKLCWDNLENLKYIGNNTWCRTTTNHYFICKDECVGCGESFLTYKHDDADYCSKSCARIYANPMKIETIKEKHRIACNKYEHRKKISDHHKGQKRPDQSKFMKKNNPMFIDSVKRKHRKSVNSQDYKSNMSEIIKTRWCDKEYREKYSRSLIEKGIKQPEELLSKVKVYRRKVKKYTKLSLLYKYDLINPHDYPIGIGENFYNIDHIYSIADGFKNNIDPKIIGSSINLQVLLWKNNIRKNSNSWVSKKELLRRYSEYEYSF